MKWTPEGREGEFGGSVGWEGATLEPRRLWREGWREELDTVRTLGHLPMKRYI